MLAQPLIVVVYKISAQSISPTCKGQAVFFFGCSWKWEWWAISKQW